MKAFETTQEALAAPFDVGELKFFPVALTKDKTKGKVGPYIDARCVEERLDSTVGVENWGTTFEVLDPQTKAMKCSLSVRFGEDWITKTDVGYPNEGKDADNADKEPYKAAVSDALKRAAVQFGIGRYIYSLELERDWLPVDQFGKFTEQPRLKGSPAPAPQRPVQAAQAPSAAATAPGATFPGVTMVNGDGTLNFNEFWAACRRNNITRDDVAKELGGDVTKLQSLPASQAVDLFNVLREKKQPVSV